MNMLLCILIYLFKIVSQFYVKCNCVISFWLVFSQCEMTGVVVDVGDGGTHVVPVAEGYVIGNSIKSIPVSGKDVTLFIEKLMKVLFLLALSKLGINQLLVLSSCKCMQTTERVAQWFKLRTGTPRSWVRIPPSSRGKGSNGSMCNFVVVRTLKNGVKQRKPLNLSSSRSSSSF